MKYFSKDSSGTRFAEAKIRRGSNPKRQGLETVAKGLRIGFKDMEFLDFSSESGQPVSASLLNTNEKDANMQAARFEGWERDDTVATGTTSTWTNMFIAGDGAEDEYDMLIVGEPGRVGPTMYSVTGTRDGRGVTFAERSASSWDEACRLVEIEARRASIRAVE